MANLAEGLKKTRVRSQYAYHRLTTHRASARTLRADGSDLTPTQERVLAELREEGLSLVTFDDLVGDAELWQALDADMRQFADEAAHEAATRTGPGKAKERYLLRSSRRSKEPMELSSPLLRLALSDAVLSVANTYLGLQSKLILADRWYTLPAEAEKRVASQRWHRDHVDRDILKVFTYFSHVDREAGALEYIRGSAAGGRYGDLWPWRPLSDSDYPPQDELESRTDSEHRVAAEGGPGTMVFCNTGGFHRGGYAQKVRLMSVFNFVSPASLRTLAKRQFDIAGDPAANGLSAAARAALG